MGKSQENFEDISIFSKDWSKQIIPDATIEHLDKSAIAIAREKYKEKMNRSHITEEVDNMTDEEVLAAIESYENTPPSNEPTAEERIAAALEYQTMASLPDEKESEGTI